MSELPLEGMEGRMGNGNVSNVKKHTQKPDQ